MDEQRILSAIGAAAVLLGAALAATWAPALLVKARGVKRLRATSRGKLAITFDDGPGPLLTAALVELFRKHQAKATFYLVGFRALRSPESCDLLRKAGHELGCHTHWHRRPWMVAPWASARDVHEGFANLAPWLDERALFRPPFGKLTTWSWLAARKRRAALSWWTCDGCDTHPQLPDPEIVAQRIVNDNGGVVLLHSHDRGKDRHDFVLAVAERLLVAARAHGWPLCTMSELIEEEAGQGMGAAR